MSTEFVTLHSPSTSPLEPLSEDLHGSQANDLNVVGANGVGRKTQLRYQHGYLYRDHGAWFVRYRQRDSFGSVSYSTKHLGRCKDSFDISEVEQCRTQFMQTVNRDRLNGNARITLAAFVEGAYLPWTKEERRASTKCENSERWTPIECCAQSPKKRSLPERRCNTLSRS